MRVEARELLFKIIFTIQLIPELNILVKLTIHVKLLQLCIIQNKLLLMKPPQKSNTPLKFHLPCNVHLQSSF